MNPSALKLTFSSQLSDNSDLRKCQLLLISIATIEYARKLRDVCDNNFPTITAACSSSAVSADLETVTADLEAMTERLTNNSASRN